jgi:hypothetical protein
LSYEKDSLNALKAVLDRFPNQDYQIEHLWGVPLQPKPHLMYPFYAEPPATQTLMHSCFDFPYGLCWTHGAKESASQRRESFPSWSWTGWVGPVSWLIPSTVHGTFKQVGYEKRAFSYIGFDGKVQPVRKWQVHQGHAPPRFLNVKAVAIRLKFHRYSLGQDVSNASLKTLRKMLQDMEADCAQNQDLLELHRNTLSKLDAAEDSDPVAEESEESERAAFYVKSYKESSAKFETSGSWTPAEASRLHLTRTSIEGQDWQQRLLSESWPAIILGQDKTVTYWLVLGQIRPEDDFYERIGVIQMATKPYSFEFQPEADEFRLG